MLERDLKTVFVTCKRGGLECLEADPIKLSVLVDRLDSLRG